MPTINKVLYNVDQTGDTSASERQIARENIGYHELVGRVGDTGIDETTRVAPLDDNGIIPSDYLPGYVDDVVEGYFYNGKFYKESSHTTEIPGERDKIYVDITSSSKGPSYRWSGSTFILISGQDTFSSVKIGNQTISADQVMDTLEIVEGSGIKLTVDENNDKFTIGHSYSGQSGTVGSKQNVSDVVKFDVPWAEYDAQGHITGNGTHEVSIAEASLTDKGVVMLTSTLGNDETTAVTPKGVSTGIQTAIQTAISGLSGNISGSPGQSKTLTALSESNGIVSATFGDINISASQVTSGILPVNRGGTGIDTVSNVNSVLIGNSSSATSPMQTVRSASGAFYSTGQDVKPTFGTLPVAQGGTGVTGALGGAYNPVYITANGFEACDPKASVPYIDMTQQKYAQTLVAQSIHGSTQISWIPWTPGRKQINVYSTETVEAAFEQGLVTEIDNYYHEYGIIPYVFPPNSHVYCYETNYTAAAYNTVVMECTGFEHTNLGYTIMHKVKFGRYGSPVSGTTYRYEYTTSKIYDMDISGTYDNSPNTVYFL